MAKSIVYWSFVLNFDDVKYLPHDSKVASSIPKGFGTKLYLRALRKLKYDETIYFDLNKFK